MLDLNFEIHFELVFEWSVVEVQLHSFECGYSVTSTPFDRNIDENIDQHSLMKILNYLDTSVSNQVNINVRLYFWTLDSVHSYVCLFLCQYQTVVVIAF